MKLRRVGGHDIEAAAHMHLATALSAYAGIFPPHAPKPTVEDMADRWQKIVAEGIGWLAEDDGEVVGIAGLLPEGRGARLEAVYVTPDRWSRGVGSRLVDQAESEAIRRGWLPLRLWVLEKNDRSRSWYERRGWHLELQARRTVWGPIDDVGYVFGERGIERWRGVQGGGGRVW